MMSGITKGSRYTYPRIGGHEYAGVIEKLGKDVDNGIFHIGQKVVNYIIDECGVCYNCKHEHENICDSAESGKNLFITKEVFPDTSGFPNTLR